MVILPIIAALLPVFILASYTWSFDLNPEPKGKLVRSFIYGAIICVPIIVVEIITENLFFGSHDQPSTFSAGVVKAFFVAALPEEGFKLLALWLVLRRYSLCCLYRDGVCCGRKCSISSGQWRRLVWCRYSKSLIKRTRALCQCRIYGLFLFHL